MAEEDSFVHMVNKLTGHQYSIQEEIGDDEALIGSQRRHATISTPRERKVVEQVKVEHRIIYLYYQQLLRKQIQWLITHKSYPPELDESAKSLWILWVSLMGDLSIDSLSNSVHLSYTLAICFLACNSIGITITAQEVCELPFEQGFPYFVKSGPISNSTKLGGYKVTPDVSKLNADAAIIMNRMEPYLKLNIDLQQSALALKMFRTLGIPMQLYSKFKYLYYFHQKTYSTDSKARTTASICLLIAKMYDCYCDVAPKTPIELRSLNLRGSYEHLFASIPVIKTEKRKNNEKILDVALTSIDSCGDDLDAQAYGKQTRIEEVSEISLQSSIKSYDYRDKCGFRPRKYVRNLQKISTLLGLQAEKLEQDLQRFEELLDIFTSCEQFTSEI